ncbi:MAG: hypothetical protein IMZ53_13710 [Thermoplasmata archaeon]|nr:hypothetical protein [Thermoplasmata archaeon]
MRIKNKKTIDMHAVSKFSKTAWGGENGMRKLIAVLLIMIFLVPVGAMAGITQPISKPTQAIIIEVGDVINGEEVVWVAPNLNTLGSNEVAYLTTEKTEVNSGSPSPVPAPGPFTRYRSFRVVARAENYWPLFWTVCRGKWYFTYNGGEWHSTVTDTGSNAATYGLRWTRTGFNAEHDDLLLSATGYFEENNPPWRTAHLTVAIICFVYGMTYYNYDLVYN